MKSQNQRILKHLKSGRTLTALKALQMFSCLRLSARIYDIIEMGYNIKKRSVKTNTGKHIIEYRM